MPDANPARRPTCGSAAGALNDSLTKLYREFGDRWEIEQIPRGARWIAVYRKNPDDYIRLVLAHDISGLRFQMTAVEKETPEEPDR
jgi:hypothetical protein